MKYTLTLLLGALVGFSALPSTAEARTVVVVEHPHHHYHYVRRAHRVHRRAHVIYRHGHRVLIPARTVVTYY